MVRPSELESPTPTMSRWCSNQLSYGRILNCFVSTLAVPDNGDEY